MERQLFNPIVLSLIIAADCLAIYDLLRYEKKRSVLYKVVMVCLILLLPLLGVSIYYAIKNRHLRRRCSVSFLTRHCFENYSFTNQRNKTQNINPGHEKNNLENSLDHPWGMGVVRYHPELTRECRSF